MEYMTLPEKKQYFCQLLERTRAERAVLRAELDAIGFSLLGEKAQSRRILKEQIAEKTRIIGQTETALRVVMSAKPIQKEVFAYTVYGRTPKWCHVKAEDAAGSAYMIAYVPSADAYYAYDKNHKPVEILPDSFQKRYGRYRDFAATLDRFRVDYINHIERRIKIYLTIAEPEEGNAKRQ